jgi:hypothetical protein
MNNEKNTNWPILIGNMLIWMNFATCAWELKKTLFEKGNTSSYQIQSSKIKIGGLENKNSKITVVEDKEKVYFSYNPCENPKKEK